MKKFILASITLAAVSANSFASETPKYCYVKLECSLAITEKFGGIVEENEQAKLENLGDRATLKMIRRFYLPDGSEGSKDVVKYVWNYRAPFTTDADQMISHKETWNKAVVKLCNATKVSWMDQLENCSRP